MGWIALLLGLTGCLVTQTTGNLGQPVPGELYVCGVRAGCGEVTEWYAAELCGPMRDVHEAAALYQQQMIDEWQLRCPAAFQVGDSVCEGAGRTTNDGIVRVCIYTGD